MKYLIIGAGGTGGVVGFHMAQAGKDVTLIARDAHLESIQQKGLTLQTMWDENTKTIPVKASDMQHYKDRPDVILVCVKGYSLDGMLVTDGCIYVSANIKEPGVILQHGKILRIFFGVRQKEEKCQLLEQIQKDFRDSAIDGILSEQIQRDALEKFSYVSPIGAAGLYLNATAGDFQKEGKARELFCTMIREIVALAMAMGFPFEKDMVSVNLQILSNLPPEATTSMQRDVMAHRPSEVDGLVYEVVRMAHRYQVPVPAYEKVAQKLQGEIMCEKNSHTEGNVEIKREEK